MNRLARRALIAFFSLFLGSPLLFGHDGDKPRAWGLGVNFGGAQIDWRPSAKWMFEARAQTGSDNATPETKSKLAGIRIYRFHATRTFVSPFLGAEIAAVSAKQTSSDYDASGISAGAFIGLGLKLASHLLLEFDAGPYMIHLQEKRTKVGKTEVDFVGDTSLVVFF